MNNEGLTALLLACNQGHQNVVDVFIQTDTGFRQTSPDGFTPFQYASLAGKREIVQLFLTKKAYLDKERALALFLAYTNRLEGIVKLFMESGAEAIEEDVRIEAMNENAIFPADLKAKEETLLREIPWESDLTEMAWQKLHQLFPLTPGSDRKRQGIIKNLCSEWLQNGKFLASRAPAYRRLDIPFYYSFMKTKLGKKIASRLLMLLENKKFYADFIDFLPQENRIGPVLRQQCEKMHAAILDNISQGKKLSDLYPEMVGQIVFLIFCIASYGTCDGEAQIDVIAHLYKERTGKVLEAECQNFYSLYDQLNNSKLHYRKQRYRSRLKPFKHLISETVLLHIHHAISSCKKTIIYLTQKDSSGKKDDLTLAAFDQALNKILLNPTVKTLTFQGKYKTIGHAISIQFDPATQKSIVSEPQFDVKFTYETRQELFEDMRRYFGTPFPNRDLVAQNPELWKPGLSTLRITTYTDLVSA